ncbi:unnamed protein product [Discula destructiva]
MSFSRALAGQSRLLSQYTNTASRSTLRQFTKANTSAASRFHTSTKACAQDTVDSQTISRIAHKESQLTGQTEPVKGGPTAQAQKHVHEPLSPNVVSDITKGEQRITNQSGPVADRPAAFATSKATPEAAGNGGGTGAHTGILDSETISRITRAENELTGQAEPVKGGPTAQAQKHAGEPIGSQNLHDITEGEKVITGGERVKGGPTSTAQSELGKSRS